MKTEYLEITSRQNPLIKQLAKLGERQARSESGSFAAEGSTIVFEALNAGILPKRIILDRDAVSLSERLENIAPACEVIRVPREVYMKISSENSPEGIFAEMELLDNVKNICDNSGKFPFAESNRFILLENVQDPGNVGSIIRSAAAFGITGVLICGSADIYNPKTVRSTMGAIFKTEIRLCPDIESARNYIKSSVDNIYAAALTKRACPLSGETLSHPVCVMIGNEGKGLSDAALSLSDRELIIPMKNMESLNAAAAAAIIMFSMQS